jgi:hypothetical protein
MWFAGMHRACGRRIMIDSADEFFEAERESRLCVVCKGPLDRAEPGWELANLELMAEDLCAGSCSRIGDGQHRAVLSDRPLASKTCSEKCAASFHLAIKIKLGFVQNVRSGRLRPST